MLFGYWFVVLAVMALAIRALVLTVRGGNRMRPRPEGILDQRS